MAPNRTTKDRDDLKDAADEGLRVISNAADSASKVIVQSAADAVRVLTAAAADAARVVSAAAAVSAKVVDEKTGTDHETIIRIELGIVSIEKSIEEVKDNGKTRDQRMSVLEGSRGALNILISIGIGILTLETGLLVWHLFKTGT